MCLEGIVTGQRRAMEHSGVGGAIPRPAAMQTAAIVVDEEVVGAPAVAVDELWLSAPLEQLSQQLGALF